jgi:hypothetical protein
MSARFKHIGLLDINLVTHTSIHHDEHYWYPDQAPERGAGMSISLALRKAAQAACLQLAHRDGHITLQFDADGVG